MRVTCWNKAYAMVEPASAAVEELSICIITKSNTVDVVSLSSVVFGRGEGRCGSLTRLVLDDVDKSRGCLSFRKDIG